MKQTAGKIFKLSECKTQYDYCKKNTEKSVIRYLL